MKRTLLIALLTSLPFYSWGYEGHYLTEIFFEGEGYFTPLPYHSLAPKSIMTNNFSGLPYEVSSEESFLRAHFSNQISFRNEAYRKQENNTILITNQFKFNAMIGIDSTQWKNNKAYKGQIIFNFKPEIMDLLDPSKTVSQFNITSRNELFDAEEGTRFEIKGNNNIYFFGGSSLAFTGNSVLIAVNLSEQARISIGSYSGIYRFEPYYLQKTFLKMESGELHLSKNKGEPLPYIQVNELRFSQDCKEGCTNPGVITGTGRITLSNGLIKNGYFSPNAYNYNYAADSNGKPLQATYNETLQATEYSLGVNKQHELINGYIVFTKDNTYSTKPSLIDYHFINNRFDIHLNSGNDFIEIEGNSIIENSLFHFIWPKDNTIIQLNTPYRFIQHESRYKLSLEKTIDNYGTIIQNNQTGRNGVYKYTYQQDSKGVYLTVNCIMKADNQCSNSTNNLENDAPTEPIPTPIIDPNPTPIVDPKPKPDPEPVIGPKPKPDPIINIQPDDNPQPNPDPIINIQPDDNPNPQPTPTPNPNPKPNNPTQASVDIFNHQPLTGLGGFMKTIINTIVDNYNQKKALTTEDAFMLNSFNNLVIANKANYIQALQQLSPYSATYLLTNLHLHNNHYQLNYKKNMDFASFYNQENHDLWSSKAYGLNYTHPVNLYGVDINLGIHWLKGNFNGNNETTYYNNYSLSLLVQKQWSDSLNSTVSYKGSFIALNSDNFMSDNYAFNHQLNLAANYGLLNYHGLAVTVSLGLKGDITKLSNYTAQQPIAMEIESIQLTTAIIPLFTEFNYAANEKFAIYSHIYYHYYAYDYLTYKGVHIYSYEADSIEDKARIGNSLGLKFGLGVNVNKAIRINSYYQKTIGNTTSEQAFGLHLQAEF